MPIWTPSPTAGNTALYHVPKTRVTAVTITANGLLPLSAYTFWCNGINMTWACRTPGSRIGLGLISDDSGSMTVIFSAEISADYGVNSSSLDAKYHSMLLKDVLGNVKSLSIVPQKLVRK